MRYGDVHFWMGLYEPMLTTVDSCLHTTCTYVYLDRIRDALSGSSSCHVRSNSTLDRSNLGTSDSQSHRSLTQLYVLKSHQSHTSRTPFFPCCYTTLYRCRNLTKSRGFGSTLKMYRETEQKHAITSFD